MSEGVNELKKTTNPEAKKRLEQKLDYQSKIIQEKIENS